MWRKKKKKDCDVLFEEMAITRSHPLVHLMWIDRYQRDKRQVIEAKGRQRLSSRILISFFSSCIFILLSIMDKLGFPSFTCKSFSFGLNYCSVCCFSINCVGVNAFFSRNTILFLLFYFNQCVLQSSGAWISTSKQWTLPPRI